jgi:hypothetical protein
VLGPGPMPAFSYDDHELDSVVRYVEYLREPTARGGLRIGGPVIEGLIGVFGGLVLLLVGARWIGLSLLGDSRDVAADLEGPYISHWPEDAVTPMAEVIRTGWPVFLPSKERAGEEFAHESFRAFLEQTDEQAWAILPLTADSGRIGAVRFAFSAQQPFESEACRFLRAVAQQCSVALERARLFEQERTATASLTEGLKPPVLPVIAGLELGARSLPGSADHVVGGDWYDVFELPDGAVSVVVGDVMGHGLSAASGMGQLRAALRALALTDADPAAVLTGLDRLVDGGGAVELATVEHRPQRLVRANRQLVDPGQLEDVRDVEQGRRPVVKKVAVR